MQTTLSKIAHQNVRIVSCSRRISGRRSVDGTAILNSSGLRTWRWLAKSALASRKAIEWMTGEVAAQHRGAINLMHGQCSLQTSTVGEKSLCVVMDVKMEVVAKEKWRMNLTVEQRVSHRGGGMDYKAGPNFVSESQLRSLKSSFTVSEWLARWQPNMGKPSIWCMDNAAFRLPPSVKSLCAWWWMWRRKLFLSCRSELCKTHASTASSCVRT